MTSLGGTVRLIPVSSDHSGAIEEGVAKTRINATAFKRPSLTSRDRYQFASYYAKDGSLTLARRNIDTDRWDVFCTAFGAVNVDDPHCVSVIAIDGDGFLHVAWGMHNDPLMYTRSTAPVLNAAPIALLQREIANGKPAGIPSEIPLHNEKITYPEFTNVPKSDDLLLMLRTGRSGSGDYHLFRWFNGEKRWRALNAAIDGAAPWISGECPVADIPETSPYPSNLGIDAAGCIHVSWTWRSGRNSRTAFKDYQSNHHLLYARSKPIGEAAHALEWYRADGAFYQRGGRHAIDDANAGAAVDLPEGSSLINTCSLALDNGGSPVMATWYAPLAVHGDHTRQYMLIWKDGERWLQRQITYRQPEGEGRMPETDLRAHPMSRPIVVIDDAERAIVVFSDVQRGGRVTAAVSSRPDRSDWRLIDLTDDNAGLWEPSYDRSRWEADGVLSMLYQPCGLGVASHPLFVLEWDVRSFFGTRKA